MSLLDLLGQIPTFKIPHASWPCYDEQILAAIDSGGSAPELREVFRICNVVPLSWQSSDKAVLAANVLCKRYPGMKVCINFSPAAKPVLKSSAALTSTSVLAITSEHAKLKASLEKIKKVVGDNVISVMIDDERDAAARDLMVTHRDNLYSICKTVFPKAIVQYYGFGSIDTDASTLGWSDGGVNKLFVGTEKTDMGGISFYKVGCRETEKQRLIKSVQNLTTIKRTELNFTAWVALACGYRWKTNKFHEFVNNWDYDLSESYYMGGLINEPWFSNNADHIERFGPWNKIKMVAFYPNSSLNSPLARCPRWIHHFIAYCYGAALKPIEGIAELEHEPIRKCSEIMSQVWNAATNSYRWDKLTPEDKAVLVANGWVWDDTAKGWKFTKTL